MKWSLWNKNKEQLKQNNNLPTALNIKEREISNPTHCKSFLWLYFTNIGPNLAKSIPASLESHYSFLSGNFPNSIFLESVTEQEIIETCTSFRAGAAAGYDNVSMSVVREQWAQLK